MSPPGRIRPLPVLATGVACAWGLGAQALSAALARGTEQGPGDAGAAGLQAAPGPQPFAHTRIETWVGAVPGLDAAPLPDCTGPWSGRALQLAWAGLQADGFAEAAAQAVQRHGAHRVGLALGTSASTLGVSESAYRALEPDGGFPQALRHGNLNTPHAVALFVQEALGLGGPCVTISTACSSSAKTLAVAERWLRLGLVDAVVTAGVDAFCDSVLYGFHALGLVSPQPCQPFDAQRRGINVGEAAAFALLGREPAPDADPPGAWLLGYGEANDAHHMSAPHPQGLGAERALDDALARAGMTAHDVDYLNLHGTATPRNDVVEAALVARRYRRGVHASATKGLTGHTMGAAGLLEALICLQALTTGLRSGSPGTTAVDPALGEVFADQLQLKPVQAPTRVAASHAFGFGGNNCVLLFGSATP